MKHYKTTIPCSPKMERNGHVAVVRQIHRYYPLVVLVMLGNKTNFTNEIKHTVEAPQLSISLF